MVPLAGFVARYPARRSRRRMTRDPRIMPTANTPTAIDSTTSSVRVLLPHKSEATLRQRGLTATGALPPFCGDVFRSPLPGHPLDRLAHRRGLGHQRLELVPLQRRHLGAGLRCPDRGDGLAAVQQFDLAKELPAAHRGDDELAPPLPLDQHFDLPFGDQVEAVEHLPPVDDYRARRVLQRL